MNESQLIYIASSALSREQDERVVRNRTALMHVYHHVVAVSTEHSTASATTNGDSHVIRGSHSSLA